MKNVYVIGFVLILVMSGLACTKEVEVIKEVEVEKIVTKEADPGQLVVYSGRKESLVGPIIDQFKEVTGIDVSVKYGKTGEIAATLLEEGKNSPADIFFAQEPGGLGATVDMLTPLSEDITGYDSLYSVLVNLVIFLSFNDKLYISN